MKNLFGKYKLKLFVGIIILAALPLALLLSQQVQNLFPRATEETLPQSTFTLVPSTSNPAPGQAFTVDVVLDTTKDPDFVITGVDAIISLGQPLSDADPFPPELLLQRISPTTVSNGTVFESLTNQSIDGTFIRISASNASVKDEAGIPQGFSGRGTVATITLKAIQPVPAELKLIYKDAGNTDDTNIIGFEKNKPVAEQTPRERLLTEPQTLALTIAEPSPSPTSKTCVRTGCSGTGCQDANMPQLETTCEFLPEYACYQTASCEVQANGSCGFTQTEELKACLTQVPSTTVIQKVEVQTSGNIADFKKVIVTFNRNNYQGGAGASATDWIGLYKQGSIDTVFINWKYVNDTQTAGNIVTSGTITFYNVPLGDYDIRFFLNNGYQKVDEKSVTVGPTATFPTPAPTCQPRPACLDGITDPTTGATSFCRIAEPAEGWCPKPSPSPQPQVSIELQLTLEDRLDDNNYTSGTLYGVEASQVRGTSIAQGFQDILQDWRQAPLCPAYAPPLCKENETLTRSEGTNSDGCPLAPTCVPKDTSGVHRIASFLTDRNGIARYIDIPQELQGKTMYLFVRTSSHLRRSTTDPFRLPQSGEVYYDAPTAHFTNLIPGDIFIAEGQTEQDNLINTFDAIELLKYLGDASGGATGAPEIVCVTEPCPEPMPPQLAIHKADLNADGIVNTRDLKILIDNMGQRGDNYPPTSGNITITPFPWKQCITMPGVKILESYPRQCIAPDGRSATEPTPTPTPLPAEFQLSGCSGEYNPVCASDGNTYGNECEAKTKGLYWIRGTCGESGVSPPSAP